MSRSATDSHPAVVLLIDDEFDTCTVWTMLLEAEGMHVISAHNGGEGLRMAALHCPDVVICDYMMPVMNGLDVCHAIRADVRLRDTSIVLWSAARCIEADGVADLVLKKPVDADLLLRFIRSVVPRPRG